MSRIRSGRLLEICGKNDLLDQGISLWNDASPLFKNEKSYYYAKKMANNIAKLYPLK